MTDLLEDLPVSLTDQIAEAERELRVRLDVYRRAIARGTISPGHASHQIRTQRAILESLRGLRERGWP